MAESKRAFAQGTKITSGQSRDQVERELMRHGATDFGFMSRPNEAVVAFKIKDVTVRVSVRYPDREKFRTYTRKVNQKASQTFRRSDAEVGAQWEGEARRLWRALYACLKAKLVAIEDGVETLEQAFFAHIVDPVTGRTLHEIVSPALALRHQGQDVPLLEGPNPVAGGSR